MNRTARAEKLPWFLVEMFVRDFPPTNLSRPLRVGIFVFGLYHMHPLKRYRRRCTSATSVSSIFFNWSSRNMCSIPAVAGAVHSTTKRSSIESSLLNLATTTPRYLYPLTFSTLSPTLIIILFIWISGGAGGRIWTHDLWFTKPLLYYPWATPAPLIVTDLSYFFHL